MVNGDLPIPPTEVRREHVAAAVGSYWAGKEHDVLALRIVESSCVAAQLPLRLVPIDLPDWAAGSAVDGQLLVPAEASEGGTDWKLVDWWLAAFLLLECWHERTHEARFGPIHSYSFRLKDWDPRVWRYAWVNRIAMFLQQWAAHARGAQPATLNLPKASVTMTHDVDAVAKTLPIRLKQGGFNLFNAAGRLCRGKWREAARHLRSASRFAFGQDDWWTFDEVMALEDAAGVRSRFHFYADARTKTPIRWLFDPSYDVADTRIRNLIRQLTEGGWRTGLHQSFDAWQSERLITEQRERLSSFSPADVKTCRQHWLRFSWHDTWQAQEAAGFEEDTTLMFNDRMGLRAAAALTWQPWNTRSSSRHGIRAMPTVFMDSHAYDYEAMTQDERRNELRHWFGELKSVGGQCAVLWHPHTLSADYAWAAGFRDCLDLSREIELCVRH